MRNREFQLISTCAGARTYQTIVRIKWRKPKVYEIETLLYYCLNRSTPARAAKKQSNRSERCIDLLQLPPVYFAQKLLFFPQLSSALLCSLLCFMQRACHLMCTQHTVSDALQTRPVGDHALEDGSLIMTVSRRKTQEKKRCQNK